MAETIEQRLDRLERAMWALIGHGYETARDRDIRDFLHAMNGQDDADPAARHPEGTETGP